MRVEVKRVIKLDRSRRLLDVTVGGLLSPEDAGWVGEEIREKLLELGPHIGKHVTLYDVRKLQVVPAPTVHAIRESFAHPSVRPLAARKLAFVVNSSLIRRQIERLRGVRDDFAIFDTRPTALAWLFD